MDPRRSEVSAVPVGGWFTSPELAAINADHRTHVIWMMLWTGPWIDATGCFSDSALQEIADYMTSDKADHASWDFMSLDDVKHAVSKLLDIGWILFDRDVEENPYRLRDWLHYQIRCGLLDVAPVEEGGES